MLWVRAAGLPPSSGSGSDSWCRRDGSTETRVLEVNRLKCTLTADHMTTWYQSAVHQQEVKSSVHCHAQHEFRELGYICPTVCLCLWIPLNSSVDSCSSCRCFSSLLHFINVRLSNWDTLEPRSYTSAGLVKITSAIREEITTSSLSADSRPEVSNIFSFTNMLSQSVVSSRGSEDVVHWGDVIVMLCCTNKTDFI